MPAPTAVLTAHDEGIHPITDVPGWSETFCVIANDWNQGVGIFCHIGRAYFDPTVWRQMLAIYLPDGRRLVSKSFSRGERPNGPEGNLSIQCLEPDASVSVRYDGGVRNVALDELVGGPLVDGPDEHAAFDLTWTDTDPAWHPFGEDEGAWGGMHYERVGTLKGTFRTSAGEFAFDGLGWRDHSMGQRDITKHVTHRLASAQFDDGSTLMAMSMVGKGHEGQKSRLWSPSAGATEDAASGIALPTAHSVLSVPRDYTFELAGETVHATCGDAWPMTMLAPNHMTHGLNRTPGALVFWWSHTTFSWGGRTGRGLTELSHVLP